MQVKRKNRCYSSQKKCVQGTGFVDNLSSVLKSVASYTLQHKDLIAKPILGAVGNIAALGLTEGTKAVINRLQNKNSSSTVGSVPLNAKSKEIINKIMTQNQPVTNIIGSGIKKIN